MFSRYILTFNYTYFFILKLGRTINICTLECFIRYLTFYLAVHISSYAKLSNSNNGFVKVVL